MAHPIRRFLLLCLFLTGPAWRAGEDPVPEYQVKAQYLTRLPAFVKWPSGKPDEAGAQRFQIGVLGATPFRRDLVDMVEAQTVRGLPIRVKQAWRARDLLDCQILFICESEAARLDEILFQVRGFPILTVSDISGAAFKGVMVTFSLDHKHVVLEVNVQAATDNGFVFSSFLLHNAKVLR